MKLVTNLKRARQSGMALAAAIILFVLFIIFIGTIAYVLWKAIHRIHRQPPPDDPNNALAIPDYQEEVDAATGQVKAQYGTTNVTPFYLTGITQTNLIVFLPFGTNAYEAILERSTNLFDWAPIDRLPAGEAFIDTNPPPAQAFYRRLYLNVVGPVNEETNHAASFMYLPAPTP